MKKTMLILSVAAVAGLAMWGVKSPSVHAQTGYNVAALKGTYGFTEQGGVGSNLPVVGLGVINADGNGAVSGYETINVYGSGMVQRTFQGFYTVNADGTGVLTLNYAALPSDQIGTNDDGTPVYPQSSLTIQYNFVVVNNKAEFRGMRTANGYFVTAAFARQ